MERRASVGAALILSWAIAPATTDAQEPPAKPARPAPAAKAKDDDPTAPARRRMVQRRRQTARRDGQPQFRRRAQGGGDKLVGDVHAHALAAVGEP